MTNTNTYMGVQRIMQHQTRIPSWKTFKGRKPQPASSIIGTTLKASGLRPQTVYPLSPRQLRQTGRGAQHHAKGLIWNSCPPDPSQSKEGRKLKGAGSTNPMMEVTQATCLKTLGVGVATPSGGEECVLHCMSQEDLCSVSPASRS